MTPEQMRIAAAEACGWTNLRQSNPWEFSDDPDNRVVLCGYWPAPQGGGVGAAIPNYPADLNACAEMEAGLTTEDLIEYAEWLGADRHEMPSKSWVILLRATPLQRCEAFLRVKGLWREP